MNPYKPSPIGKLIQHYVAVITLAARASTSTETVLAAAGNAFFAFFSFFPMVLLLIAFTSYWLGEPLVIEAEIVKQLELLVPGARELVGDNLETMAQLRGVTTWAAVAGLIWSASSVFYFLSRSTDLIFFGRTPRSTLHHRSIAIAYVIILSVLMLVFSVGANVLVVVLGNIPEINPLMRFLKSISQILALFLGFYMYLLMYRLLPYQKPPWKEIVPGAIVSGFLWEIAKRIFVYFISAYVTLQNLVYGSVTSALAFLLWIYVSSLIYFFGAHFAAISWRNRLTDEMGVNNILANLFDYKKQ